MEERYDPGTIRRVVDIGIARDWSCLEVGAGAGSIARWLAAEFDLVHVRWLLDLLPDREASVEKLIAALKPGGWLLVEEPDMFPTTAESSGAYRRLREVTAALLQSALPPRTQ